MDIIGWLTPWEFSPALILCFVAGIVLFVRGLRAHRVSAARQWLFWVGLVVLYLSMHTRIDYYAERLFFAHRLQHLVLHHLGPLLIMGAYPGQVLRAGLPMPARVWLKNFRQTTTGRFTEGLLTNKFLVPFLFVFLVVIWLIPTIQFYSMLDWRLYRFMNWSVVITGFLYWNLILDRRPSPPAVMAPGARIISPVITMVPQMVVGAVITFTLFLTSAAAPYLACRRLPTKPLAGLPCGCWRVLLKSLACCLRWVLLCACRVNGVCQKGSVLQRR